MDREAEYIVLLTKGEMLAIQHLMELYIDGQLPLSVNNAMASGKTNIGNKINAALDGVEREEEMAARRIMVL